MRSLYKNTNLSTSILIAITSFEEFAWLSVKSASVSCLVLRWLTPDVFFPLRCLKYTQSKVPGTGNVYLLIVYIARL